MQDGDDPLLVTSPATLQAVRTADIVGAVPEKLGDQVYVDGNEKILGTVDKVLTAATDLGVEAVAALAIAGGAVVMTRGTIPC